MTSSKACFRVQHNGIETFVPVSYFAIIQSRNYETTPKQATRLALEEVTKIEMDDNFDHVITWTPLYDDKGNVIEEGEFTVSEHFNGYSLTHNKSGKNQWLSDGVDCLTAEDGDNGDVTLNPGTVGFVEFLTEQMNNDFFVLEAFFPEIAND